MICEKCGQWIEGGSMTCSKCGAPVNVNNAQDADAAAGSAENMMAAGNAAPDGGQPAADGYYANGMQCGQPLMKKNEFYNHPNIAPVKSQIRSAGIACYIVAGITLAVSAFVNGIFWGIIGAVPGCLLLVGLGLGIQFGKSRVCAVILTVFGAINTMYVMLERGRAGGWVVLLAGIYAVKYTFKYQDAWAEYLKTGIVKDFSQEKEK